MLIGTFCRRALMHPYSHGNRQPHNRDPQPDPPPQRTLSQLESGSPAEGNKFIFFILVVTETIQILL